jgi:hypothetical protein
VSRRTHQEADPSWDTGEWVDVGDDGRWRPSAPERIRSLTILAMAVGLLLVLAALASVDDGDGDDPEVVASPASTEGTTTTTSTTTTTTTAPPDPSSLAGEPAPDVCLLDDRQALPLRTRPQSRVLVLNGTSRNGFAGATTARLTELGYATSTPGNASGRPATLVQYRPGFCAEAVRVGDDLAFSDVEIAPVEPGEDTEGAQIVVTLGRDAT